MLSIFGARNIIIYSKKNIKISKISLLVLFFLDIQGPDLTVDSISNIFNEDSWRYWGKRVEQITGL